MCQDSKPNVKFVTKHKIPIVAILKNSNCGKFQDLIFTKNKLNLKGKKN